MTIAVKQVLESFDALSESEKQRAAMEILRRIVPAAEGDMPESALIEAAEELFRALDADEISVSSHG